MIQNTNLGRLFLALLFGAVSSLPALAEDPQETESPQKIASAESNQSPQDTVPENQSHEEGTVPYTVWDFEIVVEAKQHEPAGKNVDQFNATLRFSAILPHGTSAPQDWAGFGTMNSVVVSRAADSHQAPHKAAPQFNLRAVTSWAQASNTINVVVWPNDAVTYSLTTGEVLGTTGVLNFMLEGASYAGVQGTALAFSLPDTTAGGAEFVCKFDTSDKHVCWYEGTATLKVRSKKDLLLPPWNSAEESQNGQSPSPSTSKTAEADSLKSPPASPSKRDVAQAP